ncbi:MAG: ribosomal-processing cysteine protease Prp [Firmicutes bacterium]|nr:ribosomal-processing cysteine protease Prp [Bacillota bacterium]
MINVFITRGSGGKIEGFQVQGHAGCGYRGTDIVCAGVSVLTQVAVIGLEEYLGLQAKVFIESGLLKCCLPARPAEQEAQIDAILETMVLGLNGIAAEYPDRVCIVEEEVDCDA